MIVLDTHIWIWWVHSPERLSQTQRELITASETDLIGVSAISCWEIAKLVELGRLELPVDIEHWFEQALSYPGGPNSCTKPRNCHRIHALTWRFPARSSRPDHRCYGAHI